MTDEPFASLCSIRDWIRWGASRFSAAGLHFGQGTDNALDEAAWLVLHALHLPQGLDGGWLDARLTLEERHGVYALLERRLKERIPAAYLTGSTWFAGLEFEVNEQVLIPRSPLAELIEQGFHPWFAVDAMTSALDLCTGSGCIGIALAQHFPHLRVDLADVSVPALEVARRNRDRYGLEGRVEILHSDLFEALAGRRYDLILSNPPYVDAGEMAALPAEYRHEPALGLAAGADGLDLVRRMLAGAGDHLTPSGVMIVEVGASARALTEAYPEIPFLWLEFERGGEGVFLLSAEQIEEYRTILKAR